MLFLWHTLACVAQDHSVFFKARQNADQKLQSLMSAELWKRISIDSSKSTALVRVKNFGIIPQRALVSGKENHPVVGAELYYSFRIDSITNARFEIKADSSGNLKNEDSLSELLRPYLEYVKGTFNINYDYLRKNYIAEIKATIVRLEINDQQQPSKLMWTVTEELAAGTYRILYIDPNTGKVLKTDFSKKPVWAPIYVHSYF